MGRVAVYEDTELIAGGSLTAQLEKGRLRSSHAGAGIEAAAGSGSSGFGVYEDTEFVGSRMAEEAAATMFSAGGNRRLSSAAPRGDAVGGAEVGLGLYEDTEFMTSSRLATAAGGNGTGHAAGSHGAFNMYEDTEFITRPAAASKSTLLQDSSAAAATTSMMQSSTECMGMYEDTEFITRPVAAAAGGIDRLSLANQGLRGRNVTATGAHHPQPGIGSSGNTENIAPGAGGDGGAVAAFMGVGVYEDTEFLTRPVGHAAAGSHELEIHADTELLTLEKAAASRSATPDSRYSAAGGLQQQRQQQHMKHQECSDSTAGLSQVKENLPAAAAAGNVAWHPETLQPHRALALGPDPQGNCNVRAGHSSALSSPEGVM
jgi:hypothetical protein